MNFANMLSGAAGALTNAAAGNQQGIQQGNQINQGNLMDQLALYRQQAQDAITKQTQQANLAKIGADTEELKARTNALNNPPIKQKEAYTLAPGAKLVQLGDNNQATTLAEGGAPPNQTMTPYQQALLGQNAKNHADALALARDKMAATGGKDAQQMTMAYTMAAPAIQQLKGYFGKQKNPNAVAQIGSHLPLVGNAIVGAADPDYQKAQQSSEVLATQYVETLPKGRASPQLIATMQKQIAPELGDTPATRQQKLNTILTFERAIQKRANAAASPDNPFADLVNPPANPE